MFGGSGKIEIGLVVGECCAAKWVGVRPSGLGALLGFSTLDLMNLTISVDPLLAAKWIGVHPSGLVAFGFSTLDVMNLTIPKYAMDIGYL